MNVVLPSAPIYYEMEEFGIGIALSDICYASALLLSCPFNRGEGNDSTLETTSKVPFRHREWACFLGNVEMEDDVEGRMQVKLHL